eukprot:scaffold3042_cov152-Amphora_coffeaeformis.AAC.3
MGVPFPSIRLLLLSDCQWPDTSRTQNEEEVSHTRNRTNRRDQQEHRMGPDHYFLEHTANTSVPTIIW